MSILPPDPGDPPPPPDPSKPDVSKYAPLFLLIVLVLSLIDQFSGNGNAYRYSSDNAWQQDLPDTTGIIITVGTVGAPAPVRV